MIFLVVVAAYVVAMALIGGAVLARYMLTGGSAGDHRGSFDFAAAIRYWPAAVAVVAVAFIVAWFWNPPYGFSPEDNLAYRDYMCCIRMESAFWKPAIPWRTCSPPGPHQMNCAPWLGYVTRPMQVVRIEDFSLDEVLSAADFRANFEVALVFSTKYDPPHPLLQHWKRWEDLKARFFGFHRDLPPAAVAQILGGHIVFSEERKGQWIAIIEMER